MAAKKSRRTKFPKEVVISMGNNGAYFTVHRDGVDNISKDTVVGVYKLKRTSLVKVTRTFHKLPKE